MNIVLDMLRITCDRGPKFIHGTHRLQEALIRTVRENILHLTLLREVEALQPEGDDEHKPQKGKSCQRNSMKGVCSVYRTKSKVHPSDFVIVYSHDWELKII